MLIVMFCASAVVICVCVIIGHAMIHHWWIHKPKEEKDA
jgi:hypothetical protein